MPRIPESKKSLYVLIPEDVDEGLRKYVRAKSGAKRRGLISLTVTQALREFLASHMPPASAPSSPPREICPKCGKPGIRRIHTQSVYHKGRRYVYKYNAYEHPEENRWCNIGRYIERQVFELREPRAFS